VLGFGPLEIIVVLVIALLVLGPKRLPGAGRSIGHGMREFKDAVTGEHHVVEISDKTAVPAPVPAAPAAATPVAVPVPENRVA
jgi:sec-independent protein translocase protein TatA